MKRASEQLSLEDRKEKQNPSLLSKRMRIRSRIKLVNSFNASELGDNIRFERACFLPKNKLLISDETNKSVYICKANDGSILKRFTFDDKPCDVSVSIGLHRAYVSGLFGMQVIDLSTLQLVEPIRSDLVRFMHCEKNNIWIMIKEDKNTLHKVDMNGKTLTKTKVKNRIWDFCHSVCSDTVYYTGLSDEMIYRVQGDGGKEEVFYSSSELEYPYGIAIDSKDNVYVAGNSSNTIHRISSDGHGEIILTDKDGINSPQALNYNDTTNELLVINNSLKSIFIYKNYLT